MEHRKVQITGGSSYTVSLPREWIAVNKLKKGDTILLDTKEDGTLSIMGRESRSEKRKADIKIREDADLTERTFITKYLQGYSTIRLYAGGTIEAQKRERIMKTADYFVGIELFEESAEDMIFTTVVDFGSTDINKLMRRMALLSFTMYSDAMKSLETPSPNLHSNLAARDGEVDKLDFFIMREVSEAFRDASVAKKLGLERIYDGIYILIATKNLERIADYSVSISQNALEIKGKIPEKLLDYGKKTRELLEESTKRLFDKRLEETNRLLFKIQKLKGKKEDVISDIARGDVKELLAYFNIIDGIEGMLRHSSNIAEAAINLSI